MRGRPQNLDGRIGFVSLFLALLLGGGLCSSSAGLRIWDGSSSGYWSSGLNWVFGGSGPQPGDDLVFVPGPSRLVMTNDLAANTALNALLFTGPGYVVSGNALVLNNGLHASHNGGTTRILLTPTFAGIPSITTSNATSLLVLEGPVRYDSPGLTFNVTGPIVVSNTIREFFASAPIIKVGTGTLELVASNRFDGTLFVREGTLFANHHAALGDATGQGTVVSNGATLLIGRGLLLLESSITLAGSLALNTTGSGGAASITSAISFGGSNATIDVPITGLSLNGPISGSNGFRFVGASALLLNGNSPSYTGPTVVQSGQVFAGGQLPLAPFYLAGGQLAGNGRVGPVTSLTAGGRISPGSFNTLTCGNLAFNTAATYGANVAKGTGGPISTRLDVLGTVSLGSCVLSLAVGVDSLVPGERLTIIQNDSSDPVAGTFGGLPEGAEIIDMFTRLRISYAGGDGNDVVLTVVPNTRSWVGGAGDGNWQSPFNWDGNVRAHIGDNLVFPAGAMRLTNTNNFGALTPFNSIALNGAGYALHGNSVALNAGVSATYSSGTSTIALPVRLASNQTFYAASGATLDLTTTLEMNGQELTLDSDGELRLSGAISQGGSLVKTGPARAVLSGANTYTGTTLVIEGILEMAANTALGASGNGTTVNSGATLGVSSGLTVGEPLTLAGTLQQNGPGGTNVWSAPITLQEAAVIRVDGSLLRADGIVAGAGSLIKQGAGTLRFGANNTYSGTTVLSAGTLLVNGEQPQSSIQFKAGTLGGSGALGHVFTSGSDPKAISPGVAVGFAGALTTSNLVLNSFTDFIAGLDGASPGVNHDQLVVRGTVNLNNCRLVPLFGSGLAVHHVLRIIDNDDSDAVIGTFSGLSEGATIVASNGLHLRLTYLGGDGNDVQLSVSNPPSTITSVSRTPEGFVEIHGLGLPNVLYTLEASTNLAPGSWTVVTVDLADGAGLYEMTDVDTGNFAQRFYRVSSP